MYNWEVTPLAVVVFEAEIRLLKLQLLSVDRLYDFSKTAEYTIVINSDYPEPIRSDLARFVQTAISSSLATKIKFLTFEDLVQGQRAGYYDQQAIKLALGMYFSELGLDYYLMLDAKNHFVKKASISSFLAEGKPRAKLTNINAYWLPRVEKAFDGLGVPFELANDRMMPSVTPYLLNTKAVAGLVKELDIRFGGRLLDGLKKSQGTEFLLYYAYLVKHELLDLYSDSEVPNVTFFTVHPSTEEAFSRLISILQTGEVVSMGLHRNRIPKLSAPQKRELQRIWRESLLFDWENADWFMGGMEIGSQSE